jgi:hypothetical protein
VPVARRRRVSVAETEGCARLTLAGRFSCRSVCVSVCLPACRSAAEAEAGRLPRDVVGRLGTGADAAGTGTAVAAAATTATAATATVTVATTATATVATTAGQLPAPVAGARNRFGRERDAGAWRQASRLPRVASAHDPGPAGTRRARRSECSRLRPCGVTAGRRRCFHPKSFGRAAKLERGSALRFAVGLV